MAKYILGTELSPSAKTEALERYVYRMTFESVKLWPHIAKQMTNGGYRMTLITDAQWLASTRFAVTRDGNLNKRQRYCEHDSNMFRHEMLEN